MPSISFVLPHWLYWSGLIFFPLIAAWLAAKQLKNPPDGRPTYAIAYLFWRGGRVRSRPIRVSDQPGCLTDLMGTTVGILNFKLTRDAGEDSYGLLPAFRGQARSPIREAIVPGGSTEQLYDVARTRPSRRTFIRSSLTW